MDWLGRAKIVFTHAASPLKLTAKDGSTTDLAQLCRKSTPACWLNPLLFNGHLQTMWTAVSTGAPLIYYRRRIFDSDHKMYHGTFTVDFAVDPHEDTDPQLPPRTAFFSEEAFTAIGSDDSRPMLIVLHGLSGGSYEVYLRHCIAPLLADGRDWAVCVVNSRGCAQSKVTSGIFFNARATWDVRQVAKWARETFPNRQLYGLGFSLGANIITNYVGEEGVNCPLSAAVVVGNPFGLETSNKALKRTILGKYVYQYVMGGNMKKLVSRHKEAVLKYTDLDYERIMKVTYLYEFDREVQCRTWGYPTEEAYYRDASSSDSLLNVRIPFLAVQAEDDPIAVSEACPYEEFKYNPYTVLCMTSLGGHLSWFELGGGRWHAKPVSNFLQNIATEIDLKSVPRAESVATDSRPEATKHHGASFDPLRRKMDLHI